MLLEYLCLQFQGFLGELFGVPDLALVAIADLGDRLEAVFLQQEVEGAVGDVDLVPGGLLRCLRSSGELGSSKGLVVHQVR